MGSLLNPLILLAVCLAVVQGQLTMSLAPDVVKAGVNVTLRCQGIIPSGKMITWYKRQGTGNPDIVGFNNVISNPLYTDRFFAGTPEEVGDQMIFLINIKGVRLEDSGEYGCGYMGEATTTIQFDNLAVIIPIKEMRMFVIRSNETHLPNPEDFAMELIDGDQYNVNEGDEFYLQCRALSMNPPAKMDITFGGENINADFKLESLDYLEDPIISPTSTHKLTLNDVHMTSLEPFVLKAAMSHKTLKCSASVPEYEEQSISVWPILKEFPKANCTSQRVLIYSSNVKLQCEMKLDPKPTKMYWFWEEEGKNQTLSMDNSYNNRFYAHTFFNKTSNNDVVELQIDRVTTNHFKAYHLIIENDLGVSTNMVILDRDHSGESTDGAGSTSASILLITAATLTAIFKLL